MKRLLFAVFVCLSFWTVWAQSDKECFDFDWKFLEGDVKTALLPSFDDKDWQSVDLPHDWDIFHSPKADNPTDGGGGYYPGGIGWYRKSFSMPQVASGTKIKLHFEGVYQKCKVYVNGILAGTHAFGYTPFYIDITKFLITGANLLAVRVDNSMQPNCRWYSGSGIYRHVWLETFKDGVMDDPTQLFVRTEELTGISADGTKAESAKVRITYGDKLDEVRTFNNVKLWNIDNPVLYDIKVGVLTVKYGFRQVEYDSRNGFRLNGQNVLINGACVHHDDGVLGSMAFDAAEIRKVRLMKEAGFNLIRTSHNPTTRAFLDACDSIGMMVIDEMYDGWYSEKTPGDHHIELDSCYKEDFEALVTADRNHPSIICWSIGNEVMERKDIKVVQTARKFKNEILRWDNTRPVTEALCTWDSEWEIFDPHAEVLDIVGCNYMMHKAESDHERCPERVMWQTESYPRDAFRNWKHTAERPYIIGDIVWTGLDYLGESGIGQFYHEGEPRGEHYQGTHFPFHGAYCGDVDMTGWRKPISHYRKMLWQIGDKGEKIYMAVKEPNDYVNGRISLTAWAVWPTWESWNWQGWEGKNIDVEVYSKEPEVSLYLNGNLIGTKKTDISTEFKAVFTLPYAPGTLTAKAGKYETTLKTSGKAASIRLTPDRKVITADGQDLAYIVAEVVDKDGNIVADAEETFDVSVSGNGTLLAAASASFKDLEPKTSNHVTTYFGRAVIVVRSARKAGAVQVVTKSGLAKPQSKIQIKTVKKQ